METMPETSTAAIRWRVTATWPTAMYGMKDPFTVPTSWTPEDSGAGMGEREKTWATPELTPGAMRIAVASLDTPSVEFDIEANKPDWVYNVPEDHFFAAFDAWDEYGRSVLSGENPTPPQEGDFR